MRTVELDDELAALLEREKPLDQAAHETIVMDLFRRGKVSTGKAASCSAWTESLSPGAPPSSTSPTSR